MANGGTDALPHGHGPMSQPIRSLPPVDTNYFSANGIIARYDAMYRGRDIFAPSIPPKPLTTWDKVLGNLKYGWTYFWSGKTAAEAQRKSGGSFSQLQSQYLINDKGGAGH